MKLKVGVKKLKVGVKELKRRVKELERGVKELKRGSRNLKGGSRNLKCLVSSCWTAASKHFRKFRWCPGEGKGGGNEKLL